jgi:hypothetical protein
MARFTRTRDDYVRGYTIAIFDACHHNFAFPKERFRGYAQCESSYLRTHVSMTTLIQKAKRITSTGTSMSTRIPCLLEDGIG